MSSFLSRLRREPSPGDESSPGPTPADAPPPVASRAATARSPTTNNASTPDQALVLMLAELEGYTDGLPEPSVSALRVDERALALGNRRGLERRGSFAVVELKGGRLDAVVRFQFLADEPSAVDSAVQDLQRSLLRARDALWTAGFLRITAEGTSPAEHLPALTRWRKTTDYRVLYEYHYWDTDGAESIIARIPIHSDLEELDSLPRETTTVTDEIVRWDREGAPALQVAALAGSRLRVAGLAILVYLPAGWTGTEVTLARLDRTSKRTPTLYPTLAEFLAAITDPENPDRHAQVVVVVHRCDENRVAGRICSSPDHQRFLTELGELSGGA